MEHIKRNRGKYYSGRILNYQFGRKIDDFSFGLYDYLVQHYLNIKQRGFDDLDNTSNKLVLWFNFIDQLSDQESLASLNKKSKE